MPRRVGAPRFRRPWDRGHPARRAGEQRERAKRLTRDFAFPLAEGTPVAQSFRRRLGERFAQRLRNKTSLTVSCSQAPRPHDPANAPYCPRCLAQYVLAACHCADCGTISLRPLTTV